MIETETKNGFVRWLEVMDITKAEAALLFGKTVRALDNYERGIIDPPQDLRMLMAAMAEGYKPKPWPI